MLENWNVFPSTDGLEPRTQSAICLEATLPHPKTSDRDTALCLNTERPVYTQQKEPQSFSHPHRVLGVYKWRTTGSTHFESYDPQAEYSRESLDHKDAPPVCSELSHVHGILLKRVLFLQPAFDQSSPPCSVDEGRSSEQRAPTRAFRHSLDSTFPPPGRLRQASNATCIDHGPPNRSPSPILSSTRDFTVDTRFAPTVSCTRDEWLRLGGFTEFDSPPSAPRSTRGQKPMPRTDHSARVNSPNNPLSFVPPRSVYHRLHNDAPQTVCVPKSTPIFRIPAQSASSPSLGSGQSTWTSNEQPWSGQTVYSNATVRERSVRSAPASTVHHPHTNSTSYPISTEASPIVLNSDLAAYRQSGEAESPTSKFSSTSALTSPSFIRGTDIATTSPDPLTIVPDTVPPLKANRVSHARKTLPGHVPRPRNAFILFRQYVTANNLIPREMNVKSESNMSRVAGSLWRNVPESTKRGWERLAAEEKKLHREKYPGYAFKPRKPIVKPKQTPDSCSAHARESDLDSDSDSDYEPGSGSTGQTGIKVRAAGSSSKNNNKRPASLSGSKLTNLRKSSPLKRDHGAISVGGSKDALSSPKKARLPRTQSDVSTFWTEVFPAPF